MKNTETLLIADQLKRCYEQNQTADYNQLESIVPDCRKSKRGCLVSALNLVKKEYGYLFKCIHTVGYQPIANNIKVSQIEQTRISKIKSQVNKFESELSCVNVSKLAPDEQQRYYSASLKASCHSMLLDQRLEQTYANAAHKCVADNKIDFSFNDFQDVFKALK